MKLVFNRDFTLGSLEIYFLPKRQHIKNKCCEQVSWLLAGTLPKHHTLQWFLTVGKILSHAL